MIMAVSDECFPRLVTPPEQLAGYHDDQDTSLEIGNGEQMSCAAEQDEDGVLRASVQLRPAVTALGDGLTREAALDNLRSASGLLISVVGPCS